MPINSIVDLTHIYLRFRTEYKKRIDLFGLFNTNTSSSITKDLRQLDEEANSNDSAIIEMKVGALPPFWVDLHVEAQEELTRAKELISILQKTQQKRLLCVIKDSTTKKSEVEVESLTFSICESFKRIERLAQSISSSSDKSSVNFNILRKNAEISIANELNPLSQQFKCIQKSYMSELQKNCISSLNEAVQEDKVSQEENVNSLKETYYGLQKISQNEELIFANINDFKVEVS